MSTSVLPIEDNASEPPSSPEAPAEGSSRAQVRVPENRTLYLEPPIADGARRAAVARLGQRRALRAGPRLGDSRTRVSVERAFGADAHVAHELSARQQAGTFDRSHFQALEALILNAADPADAAAAILGEFDWVDESDRPIAAYSAFETTQRTGVCRDQHTLAAYWLGRAGYDVVRFAYGSPDTLHSFLMFKDPATGELGAIEYGHVHRFPAGTPPESILQTLNPGALAFSFQSTPDSADELSVDRASVLTPQGRRLVNDMLGVDVEPGQRGVQLRTDGGGSRVRMQSEDGLVFEAIRYTAGPDEPVLQDGAAVVMRYAEDGHTVSVGFVELADIPYRTIGRREVRSTDASLGFVAYRGRGDLFDLLDTPSFRLTVPAELDLHTALPFSDAAEGPDLGLAVGASGAEFRLGTRAEIHWGHWMAATEIGLTGNRSTLFNLVEGGYSAPQNIPVRMGPRFELAYVGAVLSLSGQIDISLTDPIDERRALHGSAGLGVNLGRLIGLGVEHALSVSAAAEGSYGASVIPVDDSRFDVRGTAGLRYRGALSDRVAFSADGQVLSRPGAGPEIVSTVGLEFRP
ncbi:MAG: hypothetical protein AAFU77_17455 [Myxococcota bacterium]